jgi:Zn finger protein HypA/HybF involved in hydrogenase expression
MVGEIQTGKVVILEEFKIANRCEICTKLNNLWQTGEWTCPRCHGPSPDIAARLQAEYSKTCGHL